MRHLSHVNYAWHLFTWERRRIHMYHADDYRQVHPYNRTRLYRHTVYKYSFAHVYRDTQQTNMRMTIFNNIHLSLNSLESRDFILDILQPFNIWMKLYICICIHNDFGGTCIIHTLLYIYTYVYTCMPFDWRRAPAILARASGSTMICVDVDSRYRDNILWGDWVGRVL